MLNCLWTTNCLILSFLHDTASIKYQQNLSWVPTILSNHILYYMSFSIILTCSHPGPNQWVDFSPLRIATYPREPTQHILGNPPLTQILQEGVVLGLWHAALSYQKNKIAPWNKFIKKNFTPHYDIFWGELYFSPRMGCPIVLKCCMLPSVTKRIRLHP